MRVKFKNVLAAHRKYMNREYKDDLEDELNEVLDLFKKHKIDQAEPWTVKIIVDYLECRQMGLNYHSQRGKVVEVLIKYGEGTLFWKVLKETARLRNRQWARVAFVVRTIQKLEAQKGVSKKFMASAKILRKQAIDWRKKLLVNPLSERQIALLRKAEQELGIYYTDLSPEENGECWMNRKEEENGDD